MSDEISALVGLVKETLGSINETQNSVKDLHETFNTYAIQNEKRIAVVETKLIEQEKDINELKKLPSDSSVDIKIREHLDVFESKMHEECEKKRKYCSSQKRILNLNDKQKEIIGKIVWRFVGPIVVSALAYWGIDKAFAEKALGVESEPKVEDVQNQSKQD